ncbi:MAG: hypothetical protein WD848_07760, partial [Dehalococcoidia bacterium]
SPRCFLRSCVTPLPGLEAVIHFDETRAVEPLERTPAWEAGEPETYPHGL